jgi:hypothetical protein
MPRTTVHVPKRLVRLKKAAPYADCTVKTLRNRIADGTLTASRSGPKLILVDLDEIDTRLIRRVAAASRLCPGREEAPRGRMRGAPISPLKALPR